MTLLLLVFFRWQQQVEYTISVSLDTAAKTLMINEVIVYHNNAPTSLDTLYFHLYANAYKDNNTVFAKELKRMGGDIFLRAKPADRGWIEINSVTNGTNNLEFVIDETIMAVILDNPLDGGDSVVLHIEALLKIPKIYSRLGYKDNHFEIVQWYPKLCVYDEKGWHKQGYHALGEFHGEFGRFDVNIELPSEFVVAATGEIVDSAKISDGRKVLHYVANDVHDFAWVCDPDFEIEVHNVDDIDIEVYYLKKNRKKWQHAGKYAVDALSRYNKWLGKYPYKKLSVVQGYFGEGMEYPHLVIIGGTEDGFTRQFELAIVHEIAHQWFYGILGSNEMDEAWLDEGFTSYAEARYFVDKYGITNSFFKSPLIPALPHNFKSKFVYYITLTNNLEKPVLTRSSEFVDVPVAYQNAAYSKPALFLRYLEAYLGPNTFDNILKSYYERYQFKHPKTEDFIAVCEEISNKNLADFFHNFLNTTAYCDWHIKKIAHDTLIIENKGEFILPTDLYVKTDIGGQILKVEKSQDTIVLANTRKIKKVVIDPFDYTPEADRYNNFYPRKLSVKPFFAWPSLDAYQVFFLPYLWYDSDDGFTPGIYLAGAQFIDFDFVKGKNQWTFGYIYGMRSHKHYYSLSYQTPVVFEKGLRQRIFVQLSNSNDEIKGRFGLITNKGIPLSGKDGLAMENFLTYNNLGSFAGVDSIDWSIAEYYALQNSLRFKDRNWMFTFSVNGSHRILNKEWHYIRGDIEIDKRIWLIDWRLFAGKIFGICPNQEKIFLSGALRHTFITDLFFGQKGYTSPQEHIHIQKDGNMAGYQTMHIKTDRFVGLNLQFPENLPVRLFCDFGYYYNEDRRRWQYAYDGGAKLALGPICFILPLFNHLKFWPKNWSLELIAPGIAF